MHVEEKLMQYTVHARKVRTLSARDGTGPRAELTAVTRMQIVVKVRAPDPEPRRPPLDAPKVFSEPFMAAGYPWCALL